MNIIIIGCGKVGMTIAEELAGEGHNLTVIDSDSEVVRKATEALDISGIVGNGAIHAVQVEAGIENAQLLVAVTPDDELNLLCCLIAKKSSGCETIARVRNPDYLAESGFVKEKLGLSAVINPEYEAAAEINRLFCIPSAIDVSTFAGGKVELLKMQIPANSPIANKPIMEAMGKLSGKVLICAVERDGEVTIPNGSFVLNEGDEISFITTRKDSESFFKKAGLDSFKIKSILIVGGGKLTYYLAGMMLDYGFKVKIIEKDKKRCDFLSGAFPASVTVINGDGTDPQTLYEERVDKYDGFASMTHMDEENILLSLFVSDKTKAKVITKVNRRTFDEILDKLDIGSVISPKEITAQMIVSYVRALDNSQGSNVKTLYNLIDGKVEALEFNVKAGFPGTGIALADLETKDDLLICCITRNDKTFIPNGMSTIEEGDSVVVVTTEKGLNDLKDILR